MYLFYYPPEFGLLQYTQVLLLLVLYTVTDYKIPFTSAETGPLPDIFHLLLQKNSLSLFSLSLAFVVYQKYLIQSQLSFQGPLFFLMLVVAFPRILSHMLSAYLEIQFTFPCSFPSHLLLMHLLS